MRDRTKVLGKIKKFFKHGFWDSDVSSIYVYGSILQKSFSEKSDVDLFIILKKTVSPFETINKVIAKIKKIEISRIIDWDFVFEPEVKLCYFKRSAIGQYYQIAKHGICVYGKPILAKTKFSLKKFYEATVWVAQKARHEYLNNKDTKFWAKKLRRDVLYSILRLNFLSSPREPSYKDIPEIVSKYPHLAGCEKLINPQIDLKTIWIYSEKLRVTVESLQKLNEDDFLQQPLAEQ